MIQNYLKIAWRNLKRNKVFSLINILGLSVGLSCCMLIALYIWHENSYDSYHPHIDRLYQIGDIEVAHGEEMRFQGCPSSLAALFKSVFPQVEATARICPLLGEDKTLLQYHSSGGDTRSFNEEKGFVADSGFFRLFKYDFTEGSPATAISGPYSIVLSKDIADKLFGGKPALGKTVHVNSNFNGEYDYTVTGVYRPMDRPSHIDARFFISMYGGWTGDFIKTNRGMGSNYFFVTYALLKNSTDAATIESALPAFVNTYENNDLKGMGGSRKRFLLKVKDIHLHSNMLYGDVTPSGSVTYLYILASIAAFTLLIACINFMNLATARSTKRAAEVGVRKTLGAHRTSLVRQFLGESLLMAFIAFGIAIGLSVMLFGLFEKLSGKTILLSVPQAIELGVLFLVLTLLTGLLAGSYPALYLSSFQPVKVLKGKIAISLAVVSLRRGLVVFQFCISIVLIVAAVIIASQMHFLRTADLGFNKDQQLILPLRTNNSHKLYTVLKGELKKTPGVQSVGASYFYPGFMGWSDNLYAEGKNKADQHFVYSNYVDFDFMKTLEMQAVAGHLLTDQYAADSVNGIVLNETAIRDLGYTPATSIGKKAYSAPNDGRSYTIVGVVKDFHTEDLHIAIRGTAFFVSSSPSYHYIITHVSAAHMDATIAAIRRVWQSVDPNEPFEYSFLDEQFQQHYEADNRLASLVGIATGIAIFISCLGLFGLAAFSAEQRTKEIGIRKVLGASAGSIVGLLSGEFLKLVSIAVLIGSPVGWWLTNKWLREFAYRVPVSWTIFFFTTAAAMLIAFATISFQAIRAASANPVKSLRAE